MHISSFVPSYLYEEMSTNTVISSYEGKHLLAQRLGSLWSNPHQSRQSFLTPPFLTPLEKQVRSDKKNLLANYDKLVNLAEAGIELPPAAEWIIDNYFVVEETLNGLRSTLSTRAGRTLASIATEHGQWPRIYALAQAFLYLHDYTLTIEALTDFIHAFQISALLTLAEFWLLPDIIRAALAHKSANLAANIIHDRYQRMQADVYADALILHEGHVVSRPSYGLNTSFHLPYLAQLLQRLRDKGVDHEEVIGLIGLYDQLAPMPDDIIHRELIRQGLQSQEIRNTITSLRYTSSCDWIAFCEAVNPVDRILREGGDFASLDLRTRNIYRSQIEKISKRSGRSEAFIAAEIVALTQNAEKKAPDTRAAHAGYYLIAEGYPILRAALGLRRTLKNMLSESSVKARFILYAMVNMILITYVMAFVLGIAFDDNDHTLLLFIFSLLIFLPAWEATTALINNFSHRFFPVTPLPALALRDGIPDTMRTAIVIPSMLSTKDNIRDLVQQLEVHYLCNKDDNLSFFLLTDWKDASKPLLEGDEALLGFARNAMASLNTHYPRQDGGARFYLMHRHRKWNANENCWMGWERKRGKLHEFNQLLLGSTTTSYFLPFPNTSWLQPIRYVVTLDADTRLTHHAVKRLIGKMAHPLNKAVMDTSSRRVVEGYGILQPRVASSLPSGDNGTLLQHIFYRASGIDPYAFANSDLYQDLFAEGSFTGKGIYDLAIFEATLSERLPENAILSHDLIEGVFARAGLASDIEVIEEYPQRYDVVSQRQHRWVRGDWQLLPWIFGKYSHDVTSIGYWKMVDNLRRSLTPIMTFSALIAIWATPLHPSLSLTAMLLGLTVMPLLIPFINGALPQRGMSFRAYSNKFMEDVSLLTKQIIFQFAFLPHQAWLMIDAIGRTIWRLVITKRNLLEWVTASEIAQRLRGGLCASYISMLGGVVISILAITWVASINPSLLVIALPFFCIWLAAPWFAHVASKAIPVVDKARLNAHEQQSLENIARQTWRFFETWVTAEDNHLPPDNFQEDPQPVIAHRTSPTNIGVYLLSCVAALDFGWISTETFLERIEKTLATMGRMQCYRGHFLNWYDTTTLQLLEPHYVSSVDSGNLAACLLSLEIALREIDSPRTHELADQTRHFFDVMDFSFLLNKSRRLLSIGWHVNLESLDESCYDMLASEARLGILLSIAKGDIPAQVWFRLSRSLTVIGITPALVSWSGSMFEYLMPALLLREPAGSLLGQTSRMIVDRQREYGLSHLNAWGISESAYNARDWEMNYQYSAFGVPGLGIKRGLSENLVLAPYATGLAAMVDPVAALENYHALERLGGKGSYGFYESIDFTPERLPSGCLHISVRAYMAHHQGMTILAIHNVLKNGLMRDRFHQQTLVKAVELFLQEVPPRYATVATPRYDEVRRLQNRQITEPTKPLIIKNADRTIPAIQILGNGNYNCLLTSSGSGYSRLGKSNVTRTMVENRASDIGNYIYLRDTHDARIWSAGILPTLVKPNDYTVTFNEYNAEYHRRDGSIETTMRVIPLSSDNGEARSITLTNNARRIRRVQLISYMELVLGDGDADAAHPSFAKMFVHTRYDAELGSLIATRRPRHQDEASLWAAHFITDEDGAILLDGYETDRALFIGRGQNLCKPAALQGEPATNSQGTTLDPVFSLRTTLELKPDSKKQIIFWTLVADSEAALIALIQKYRQIDAMRHAQDAAWLYTRLYLQHFHISASETQLFHAIASRLIFNDATARASARMIRQGAQAQRHLWPAGISGDRPIVLLRVNGGVDRNAPEFLVKAHTYLAMKGFAFDLVIIHEGKSSYLDSVYQEIEIMVRSRTLPRGTAATDTAGRVFLLRRDQIDPSTYDLVLATARLVLTTHRDSIGQQISAFEKASMFLPKAFASDASLPHGDVVDDSAIDEFANGYGGFVQNGAAYRIVQSPGTVTPAPWINILTNPEFGCLVAENGASTTWSMNSRENKLSPWSNDPVINPSGEALYLRDEETGALWSPTSSPIRISDATYVTQHGLGDSIFKTSIQGIATQLTIFVPFKSRYKVMLLDIHNTTSFSRNLSLTGYVDLLLGVNARLKSTIITTDGDTDNACFYAENRWVDRAQDELVFYHMGAAISGFITDRAAFLGPLGDLASPRVLSDVSLMNDEGSAGTEPCFAIQTLITLSAGEKRTIPIVFGVADDREQVNTQIANLSLSKLNQALHQTKLFWKDQTSRVTVTTPDRAMDIMLNGWLMYQTLACRLWARSGFYQSSGAYGYRDQLQDIMAAIYADPAYARTHILRAASRQFPEGDVQHWWLPSKTDPGPGIRTLFSDDPVWLVFATAFYINITNDKSILDAEVHFLEGPLLESGHAEAFFMPTLSVYTAPLAEHCRLALERGLRTGRHGLCLMGGGDWNDGMNRIGVKGEGESVWLTWFVIRTIDDYITATNGALPASLEQIWRQRSSELAKAAEQFAWDGQWYRRAFDDEGDAVGASTSQECRIDSLAQSWAVISGAAKPERAVMAMRSADTLLNDYENRVARLFTPPFERTNKDPGYVKAYPTGVRENGGQYTHAALWMVMAMARLGWDDKAHELFDMLNPIKHSQTLREANRYKTEPYAVVADVYDNPQHRGRGGWSWYTGSSGWMYRVGIEEILGLQLRGDRLTMTPHIPQTWNGFELTYRYGTTTYVVQVRRGDEQYTSSHMPILKCGEYATLIDDGKQHTIVFTL
ncbi:MAG: hypothetical protein EB059_07730 [Alphaproteobacteria bacterium]|nr:hypothetical protein [Alphaproteobacteria bacterium]